MARNRGGVPQYRFKNGVVFAEKNKAGNEVGNEGTRALSEALKLNTTLDTLNLAGAQLQQRKAQTKRGRITNHGTENQIDWEGAKELSKALKANTALVILELWGVLTSGTKKHRYNTNC